MAKPAAAAAAAPAKKTAASASSAPPAPPAAASKGKVGSAVRTQQENAAPSNNKANGPLAPTSADAGHGKVDQALVQEVTHLKAAAEQSNHAYGELRLEMEGLEKERDFYFEKLRDIEVMLQDVEDKGEGTDLTAAIFKVLYATIDGFEPVDSSAAGGAKDSAQPVAAETF
jgi:microtubule-associated protein, RP/EB family